MSDGNSIAGRGNPCFRMGAILLAGLSLSIGWGIRGNYGHELGAMFPGAITAIAVCLLSGREDWRSRVAYFAFFGALGWGFGGSISYMQVLGFTHSGHEPSQLYGFAGLFFIGFLWAALGGAGTAMPAVLDRKSLTDMFKPISWLLALWVCLYFGLPWLLRYVMQIEQAAQRHESMLYWFDSDWVQVAVILAGILIFDLADRRFENAALLPLFAGIGAGIGYGVQQALSLAGLSATLGESLLRYQGDTSLFEAGKLVTNWPTFVMNDPQHLGWAVGLLIGVAAYFSLYGKFRCGSSLFLHMAVGWFACFLLFPVLLDVRLTPPRGDNWAGVLGTFLGATIYFLRNRLTAIVLASIVCGTIGGIGFSGIAWLKLMLVSFGHPHLSEDPAVQTAWRDWQQTDLLDYSEIVRQIPADEAWRHWQSANWHSFLEQSYGFVNGIGVIIALGLLVTRVAALDDTAPRKKWAEIFAITFALPVLTFANMIKNLNEWTNQYAANYRPLPLSMKAPLLESIELSAKTWFMFFYGMAAAAMLILMIAHAKGRRISIVPASWLGRGQLLYFMITWVFVLGNFTKALPAFRENRLFTEGVILFNAVIATMFVLTVPREQDAPALRTGVRFGRFLWIAVVIAGIIAAGLPKLETISVRRVYGHAHAGHSGLNYRFGPKANWKSKPLLKGTQHR